MSINRARQLRREPTEPERRMWALLYTFREAGQHWRRQVPLGPYYADFACHELAIVIEVDGDLHGLSVEYDAARDRYMRGRGYQVLRFGNDEVMGNPNGVYDVIGMTIQATPHPVPPPQGGRRPSRSPVPHSADEAAVPSSPPPLRGRDRVGGGS